MKTPIENLRVLQVSISDGGGGAEKVAWNLHRGYKESGVSSWMAVGFSRTQAPEVIVLPNDTLGSRWESLCIGIEKTLSPFPGKRRGVGRLRNWLHRIKRAIRLWEAYRGHEDFNFPGTGKLLDLLPARPHVVHCHNLHGGYFDLRELPWLSRQVPTILTLHDSWLLSGHCAHSFDCERWKTGCGECPDLSIYPAIRRDATAYNWQRKQGIYARSHLYVSTPSRWLMQKVEQSMLAPSVVEARVIPHGVDLSVFHPQDKQAVRTALDIPQNAKVLLFTAHGIRRNIWKDYQTMQAAVAQVAERLHGQRVIFIALGEEAQEERIGQAEVHFIPYQQAPEVVARYYQVADVYVHAARAEAWGLTITEALACGTPVIATAVGGIPEQIKGLGIPSSDFRVLNLNQYGPDEATGVLVPSGDAEAMASCMEHLLTDESLRCRLGRNACKDACQRFDLRRQVKDFLEWYRDILQREAIEVHARASVS